MPSTKISIDPGIGGTGWAVWTKDWKLISFGVLESKGDEFDKLNYIIKMLKFYCKKYNVKEVYIEYPEVFNQSIALSGALTKLAYGVGVIVGALLPRKVQLIKVREWKGNLPKDVVMRRIQKILPFAKARTHAWDAIGIGLYRQGRF